jgi:hypothetical protein
MKRPSLGTLVALIVAAKSAWLLNTGLTSAPSLWAASSQHLERMEQEIPFDMSVPKSKTIIKPLNVTGKRLIRTTSGCGMAKWIYLEPIKLKPGFKRKGFLRADCLEEPPEKRLNDTSQPEESDVIYVPVRKLEGFIVHKLPNITVPIVVISGQAHLFRRAISKERLSSLINHPAVIAWFCQNLGVYGESEDVVRHLKVHPWPYGLYDIPFRHDYTKRKLYDQALSQEIRKDTRLSLLYFSVDTNPEARTDIPNGIETRDLEDFYARMARSFYVFSPNGDRPETYRHYEALGLGTMPITQLDPWLYRHLASSVVFNNSVWDVSFWNDTDAPLPPAVNRELILEDYWVAYVERIAGRQLNWDSTNVEAR